MSTTIIGFPRLGEFRELKFTTEKYFRKEISEEELLAAAKDLRAKHWNIVKEKGITEIPSNDFSHYDNFLDAAFLFNVVPASVQNLDLSDLERYFALGRGYQGEKGDVRALPMKKWFNTNYHYIVPKFEKDTQVKLAGHKIFDEFQEAKELGLNTRPVLVGPFTFLQLSDFEEGVKAEDFVDSLVAAYQEVFAKLAELGATRIQLDEAALVKDLTAEEKALFLNLYNKLLVDKKGLEVLLQTYFGDVRDVYADLVNLPVDAIGLDFVEGKKTLELVKGGFPADKTLYAGIVNGKNIWRNNYEKSLAVLEQIPAENIVLTSSCSLLHVPFTTSNEEFEPAILNHFAFAVEKLDEIRDLDAIRNGQGEEALAANKELFVTTLVCQPLQNVKLSKKKLSNFQLFQQQLSVHSLKLRKFVRNVWLTVRVNCLKKSTMLSLLKQLMNGSNGKKISTLMSLFTVNLSVMTWLSTSVKTCQVTSSLKMVGYNLTVCVG